MLIELGYRNLSVRFGLASEMSGRGLNNGNRISHGFTSSTQGVGHAQILLTDLRLGRLGRLDAWRGSFRSGGSGGSGRKGGGGSGGGGLSISTGDLV